jgi:hypothetical protein
MPKIDLRGYATIGAEHRLLEIAVEAARIFEAFPELRARGRGFDALGGKATANAVSAAPVQRRPRQMSAAGRKRISEAARKRWANWRKERSKQ